MNYDKQKGFTLAETLIVAAIFLIVGTLLGAILVNNTGLYNSQTSLVTTGLNLNDVMREIDTYIRQASTVATGYPEISPSYLTGDSTLVLKIPSLNAQGMVSNTFDYVVITHDSIKTNLLREYIFPDPTSDRQSQNKVLSSILQSVVFTYLDRNNNVVTPALAEKVKTEVTVLTTNGLQNKSNNAITITNLRNL